MKFTRVSKDTVNCIITEDDMDEQGIKLEDLFEKKKEAMDFLHTVMQKAAEEVDYSPSGSYTPMQITVLPDHSISLTLSENSDEAFADILKNLTEKVGLRFPRNFLEELGDSPDEDKIPKLSEYLKNIKEFTSAVKEITADLSDPKLSTKSGKTKNSDSRRSKILPEKENGKTASKAAKTAKKDKNEVFENLKFNQFVFRFDDIRTAISFAARVPGNVHMGSKLYKDNRAGDFYMLFNRLSEKPKMFASVFTIAYEFGRYTTADSKMIAFIDESMEVVIEEKAIEKLRKINK